MESQCNILAFDTALNGISVGAISRSGQSSDRQIETQREQAALLVPTIQEVLDEINCGFQEIDLIVSTVGPGSFTGLRIGLCTARVMAMCLDKPIVGVKTLDIIAQQYLEKNRDKFANSIILIVLETKRQDFYACFYDDAGHALCEPFADRAENIIKRGEALYGDRMVFVSGDCLTRFENAIGSDEKALEFLPEETQIDPILMIRLGAQIFEENGSQCEPMHPLYLRDADVSQPKTPPRQMKSE